MKYKDFFSYLLERYGGAEKERGIWYHGTSMKRIPHIMSRGLDPSPKKRSWDVDPNAGSYNLDKTSYGGIYVTQNLITATSSAWRTARDDKANRAIVILSLQPRSLIGDEDDFAGRVMHLKRNLAGSIYHAIYPYMWEVYGAQDYQKEYADKYKDEWVKESMESLFYHEPEKPNPILDNPKLQSVVEKLLRDVGYKAMLARMMGYLTKQDHYRRDWWEWRKAYADVHGIRDYGEEVDIPEPPSPREGESIFRNFIDKLTRTMKSKARHLYSGSFSKTARSMQVIGFKGSNRIVCIAEIVEDENRLDCLKILYGEMPEDFVKQWRERVGDVRIV